MNECFTRSFVARGLVLMAVLTASQYAFNEIGSHLDPSSITTASKPTMGGKITANGIGQKLDEAFFPGVAKDTEQMKQAEREYHQLYNGNHTITLEDLSDLTFAPIDKEDLETWEEALATRRPIMDMLDAAGLQVNLDVLRRLPRWSEVTNLYGEDPVILGSEACQQFRNSIPTSERFVGVAGQMNTGTNALSKYLQQNLKIPENEVANGVLWTVPWYDEIKTKKFLRSNNPNIFRYKHGWASLKHRYNYRIPDNHSKVLAVVLIKDPLYWMKRYVADFLRAAFLPHFPPISMCQSPYTLQWKHDKQHCPTLVNSTNSPVPVKIRWSKGFIRSWPSLAHLWSSWYREYYESDMPRIFVRYEDLLFHTETVVDSIRQCVGASWKSDIFQWQAAPAKTHPYFAKFKPPSSLVSAIIKYGSQRGRWGTMNEQDRAYARQYIDQKLVDQFHYQKL